MRSYDLRVCDDHLDDMVFEVKLGTGMVSETSDRIRFGLLKVIVSLHSI